jgi:hypothetical protein
MEHADEQTLAVQSTHAQGVLTQSWHILASAIPHSNYSQSDIEYHFYVLVLELHGLYSSPSIVRVIRARRMGWEGHVARMGEVRGAYNILVGKSEGWRPLERPGRRWEDNIKMDLGEIRFGDVDWIRLAHYRDRWRALVNTVMSLRVP